jgi:hypothetical protein
MQDLSYAMYARTVSLIALSWKIILEYTLEKDPTPANCVRKRSLSADT